MSGRSLSAEENAEVLKAVRHLLARGETQTSLAEKLDVQQSTLSSLLGGRHQAGWAFARKLATLLRTDVDFLLAGGVRFSADGQLALPLGGGEDPFPARSEAIRRVLVAAGRVLDMNPSEGETDRTYFWQKMFTWALADVEREAESPLYAHRAIDPIAEGRARNASLRLQAVRAAALAAHTDRWVQQQQQDEHWAINREVAPSNSPALEEPAPRRTRNPASGQDDGRTKGRARRG